MSVGKTIADLREKRSLSQAQLAKKLHISTSTLGMYETDKRKPNTDMLKALADFFNVSTDYLLGRKDEKGQNEIDKMLDEAMSNDGKPMTDNDREIIKGMIEAYLKNKK